MSILNFGKFCNLIDDEKPLVKKKKVAPKKVGKYICITAFINNWKFLRLFCKDLTFHTNVVEIVG